MVEEPKEEPLSWAYLVLLLLFSGLILFVVYGFFGRSESTTFSIVSKTRVFSVRPICGARILWDLPPGTIGGFSRIDSPQGRLPPRVATPKAISLGFGDDAIARVAMDDSDRVVITVRPLKSDKESNSIFALQDEKRETDGNGYVYRTTGKTSADGSARGDERVLLTLRLLGRVVIGDVLPEGAGSRKSSIPILDRGYLYGFGRAWKTGERLTLISEPIDPGAVVDTHPQMNPKDAKGERTIDIRAGIARCTAGESGGWPAEGFVRDHQDGDLEVVVYRRGSSVGIAPLGGPSMEIGVTWWSAFIASPVIQTGVALFGVLFFGLQILTANRRLLPGRSMKDWLKDRLQKILKRKR